MTQEEYSKRYWEIQNEYTNEVKKADFEYTQKIEHLAKKRRIDEMKLAAEYKRTEVTP